MSELEKHFTSLCPIPEYFDTVFYFLEKLPSIAKYNS